jgi:hypothetical protein
MPIKELLTAAGGRVHAGKEGLLYDDIGRIVVDKAPLYGVDERLWSCLRIAVDQLGLVIGLHASDRDQGQAVTIHQIGPERGVWHPATLANPEALRLAEYLQGQGFRAAEEGEGPAVRLGPPFTVLNPTSCDHTRHLWVSLARNRRRPA